jgi:membrane protein implicated in regulation of membrane protease activity
MNFSKVLSYGAAGLFVALVALQVKIGFATQTTILSVVLVLLAFYKDSEFNRSERIEMEKKAAVTKAELEDKIAKLSEELANKEASLKDRVEFIYSQMNSLKLSNGFRSK